MWDAEVASECFDREHFGGEVITVGDAEYERARSVWNGLIDRRPAVVLRCASASDVQHAVRFARDHELPLAVRGGGHSVAGHGTIDGGIVIDLAALDAVTLDGDTVTAGGGATWGAVDAVTQRIGRAVPGGVFSRTGIAGLSLGGGYGWIRNRYGLSARSLLSAEVVTATGEMVTADAEHNPDLLWTLRGGGGNFGIVTAFTFQTHPVATRGYFLFVLHDAPDDTAERGLRVFREFCADAPHTVSMLAMLGTVPTDAAGFVEGADGRSFIGFAGLFLGEPEEGELLLRPLREFGEPLLDASGTMAYTAVQQIFDADYPYGARYYWKSTNVLNLDDDVVALLAQAARTAPSDLSTIDIWHVAGEAAREFDGALRPSTAPFLVNSEANWTSPEHDAVNIAWTRDLVAALAPHSDGSRYLNFAGFNEDGQTEMASTFGSSLRRLEAGKRRWDPENVFRFNQNVSP